MWVKWRGATQKSKEKEPDELVVGADIIVTTTWECFKTLSQADQFDNSFGIECLELS